MTTAEARSLCLTLLHRLAPEADLAALEPDADLREQLDVDSMDFLDFIIGLNEATGIEIPEAEYGQLSTLDDCAGYLVAHAAGAAH